MESAVGRNFIQVVSMLISLAANVLPSRLPLLSFLTPLASLASGLRTPIYRSLVSDSCSVLREVVSSSSFYPLQWLSSNY